MRDEVRSINPSELFKRFIDENVLAIVGECIIKGYSESYLHCHGKFKPKQAHDLFPYYRRIAIDQNIIEALSDHEKVKIETCANTSRNSFHVKIIGGHASATISAVDTPLAKARRSLFRDQYAFDNEYSLFPDIYDELQLDKNIYGIFLHGTDYINPSTPRFINLMFPNGATGSYLVDNINILEIVKNTRRSVSNIDAPEIEDIKIYVRKKEA